MQRRAHRDHATARFSVAVAFFVAWLVVLLAGADYPPPPGFLAVVLIDLVAAFVVYWRVPDYVDWAKTRRPRRWLRAAVDGSVAGVLIAGLALLLPFGGEPSIRRSATDVLIWCAVLAAVGAVNALVIYGVSAIVARTAGAGEGVERR